MNFSLTTFGSEVCLKEHMKPNHTGLSSKRAKFDFC